MLATSMKKKSREQAQAIEKAQNSELNELKQRLSSQLQSSARAISNDIQTSQSELQEQISEMQSLTRAVAIRTWLPTVLIALIVLAAVFSVTAWQSKQIATNAQTISDQKAQLTQLKANANVLKCDNRLCVKIDTTAPEYENGYRVIAEKN